MANKDDLAKRLAKKPWKRPEDLVAEKRSDIESAPIAETIHGRAIPVHMGTISRKGDVFWQDGPTRKTVDGKTATFASFAVAVADNVFQRAGKCLRVKMNDDVVYDIRANSPSRPTFITISLGEEYSRTFKIPPSGSGFSFYDGIDNDFEEVMQEIDGVNSTPAYHRLRYAFFRNLDLTPFDDLIPTNIQITWTDSTEVETTIITIPLLGSAANGYEASANSILCYDDALGHFYLYHDRSDDDYVYIGTTDFEAEAEVALVRLTAPAATIDTIYAGCALAGTGMFITEATGPALPQYHLLVEAETGATLAYESEASVETRWAASLPFVGGSGDTVYIAAGYRSGGTNGLPVGFYSVNVTVPDIALLRDGLGLGTVSGSAIITAGKSDAEGTTFYVAEPGGTSSNPGKIYKVTFAEIGAPTVALLYTGNSLVPNGDRFTGIKYDAGSNTLVVSVRVLDQPVNVVRGIDGTTGDVLWFQTLATGSAGQFEVVPSNAFNTNSFDLSIQLTARLAPGYCVLDNTGSISVQHLLMDMSDGTSVSLGQFASGTGVIGIHFDQMMGMLWRLVASGGGYTSWEGTPSVGYTAGNVLIRDVLLKFATLDGLLTEAQVTFDPADLDGIACKGVYIDRDTDIRRLINDVCVLYGIDKIDTGTGIKFRLPPTDASFAADITLAQSDLVESQSGDKTIVLATRRKAAAEVPRQVDISYRSAEADYNVLTASASRPTGIFEVTSSEQSVSLSVPLVLSDTEAARLAHEVLYRNVAGQDVHSLTLRPKFLRAETADILDVTVGSLNVVGKVDQLVMRADNALDVTMQGYLSRVDTLTGTPDYDITPDPVLGLATRHVFLDGPLLRYSNDMNGTGHVGYHVLTGSTGWTGGILYRRRDGESVWEAIAELAGVRPVVGVLTAALPAPAWTFETDTVNELTFRVQWGDAAEITAQTAAQFYEAASYGLVGAPGRWLAVTWRDVTVNADGTITLSTLMQGLRGTEPHQGTSQEGDQFVLIKPSYWAMVPYELTDLDDAIRFKAVGYGQNPDAVPARSFTVSGEAETPRAPGDLDAVIDGSDIDITWARRSRLYVGTDASSVGALGSDLDVYKVEILSGPGGSVLRTYSDVAGEAKTYPAADIASDFGSMPDNLTFRLSQKSSLTGISYGHTATRSVALQ